MATPHICSRWFAVAVLGMVLAAVSGCMATTSAPPPRAAKDPKKINAATNLKLEVHGDQRRVLLEAVTPKYEKIQGQEYLEFFLSATRPVDKAYESVLVSDVDARQMHEMMLAAGAVRGHLVKISLGYEKDGKQVTDPAQSWLRMRKGGAVDLEWVYIGSQLVEQEPGSNRPPVFLAEATGNIISMGDTSSAVIDMNSPSSNSGADPDVTYNLERIPPPGTKVTVILEPGAEIKKSKK